MVREEGREGAPQSLLGDFLTYPVWRRLRGWTGSPLTWITVQETTNFHYASHAALNSDSSALTAAPRETTRGPPCSLGEPG